MNFTNFYHVGDETSEPSLFVSCERQHPGVPVLKIHLSTGDIYIFPRRDQLESIRTVISDYLHSYPAESDPGTGCDSR